MRTQDTTLVEVRLLDETDLKAFAAGGLDAPTTEAIEAYLLHHPAAAARVEGYRRAVQRSPREQRRLM
jgi:anti-sigma factor RsiW